MKMLSRLVYFFSQLSGSIIGPLIGLYLIRHLDIESYGVFSKANFIVLFGSAFVTFGIHPSILDLVTDERYSVRSIINKTLSLGTVFLIITLSMSFLWLYYFVQNDSVSKIFPYMSFELVKTLLIVLFSAILQSQEKFYINSLFMLITSMATWGAILWSVYEQYDLVKLVGFVYPFSFFVSLVSSIVVFFVCINKHTGECLPISRLISSIKLFGTSATLHQTYYYVDGLFVSSSLVSAEFAACYGLAKRIYNIIFQLTNILFNNILYQKYFKLAKTNLNELRNITNKISSYCFIFACVCVLFIFYFAKPGLLVLFGSKYVVASYMIILMMVVIPCRFVASSIGAYLTTSGDIKKKLMCQLVIAVLSLPMTAYSVNLFGSMGLIWSYVTIEILLWLSYGFIFGFNLSNKYYNVSILLLIIISIFINADYVCGNVISYWYGAPIGMLIFINSYFVLGKGFEK